MSSHDRYTLRSLPVAPFVRVGGFLLVFAAAVVWTRPATAHEKPSYPVDSADDDLTVTAPVLADGAPIIDGALGEGEWDKAVKLAGFRRCWTFRGTPAAVQTTAYLMGAEGRLYVAFKCEIEDASTRLVVGFLTNDVLGAASRAKAGEVVTAGYLLDAGSGTLGDKFKGKPLLEASIHKTLAQTYRHLNEMNKAEQHFLRVIEIHQKHVGETHAETLSAMSQIGWTYIKQGRHRDMEKLYTKLIQIRRDVHGISLKKPRSGEQNWLSVKMPRNWTDLIDRLTTSRLPIRRCRFSNSTGRMGEAIGNGTPDDVYYSQREIILAKRIALKKENCS